MNRDFRNLSKVDGTCLWILDKEHEFFKTRDLNDR